MAAGDDGEEAYRGRQRRKEEADSDRMRRALDAVENDA